VSVNYDDVLDQIAAAEKVAEGRAGLQPWWTPIALQAVESAYRDIDGVLAARGLTRSQIATWSGYDAAVLSQALYWAFSQGAALLANVPEEAKNPDRFDLRKWLLSPTTTLTDSAGNLIRASAVGTGKIAGGYADVTSKDPVRPSGPFVDAAGRFRQW
jgi:hypothetical protein